MSKSLRRRGMSDAQRAVIAKLYETTPPHPGEAMTPECPTVTIADDGTIHISGGTFHVLSRRGRYVCTHESAPDLEGVGHDCLTALEDWARRAHARALTTEGKP